VARCCRERHRVVTAGIRRWATDGDGRQAWQLDYLGRHYRQDWGDLERRDWVANECAIALRAGRLLSVGQTPAGMAAPASQLWIITDDLDGPDTVTTILWPSDN
jgi:hypothetical protein